MLITSGITVICEIVSYFIQVLLFKIHVEIFIFLKIISIETLFNVILIIIIYPLIEKTGDVLTKIFKEKNILTKYY